MKRSKKREYGRVNIGSLMMLIFLAGLIISSLSVYLLFQAYRVNAVNDMAIDDGKNIAEMVHQHLYSVMAKGATRAEVDALLNRVERSLPGYSISIFRADAVNRQYGARPEQQGWLTTDTDLKTVIERGSAINVQHNGMMRYLLPMQAESRCLSCHSQAQAGEINGIVDVKVPLSRLVEPITELAQPVMALILVFQAVFFGLIYLILRSWVSRPIRLLAKDVSAINRNQDYQHNVYVGKAWPREVQTLASNFTQLLTRIRTSHELLKTQSLHDPLTGLFNRRYFDESLNDTLTASGSEKRPFTLLLIDLDGFKPVNDLYGHAAGDALLIAVGKALSKAMRGSDISARIGGDEFAVLAFLEDPQDTPALIERIRSCIQDCSIRVGDETLHAACSIGDAFHRPEQSSSPAELLAIADHKMYADKARRHQASQTRPNETGV